MSLMRVIHSLFVQLGLALLQVYNGLSSLKHESHIHDAQLIVSQDVLMTAEKVKGTAKEVSQISERSIFFINKIN